MVPWIFDWVTSELSSPGVQPWSGFEPCTEQCAGTVDAIVAPAAAAASANDPAATIPASHRFLGRLRRERLIYLPRLEASLEAGGPDARGLNFRILLRKSNQNGAPSDIASVVNTRPITLRNHPKAVWGRTTQPSGRSNWESVLRVSSSPADVAV